MGEVAPGWLSLEGQGNVAALGVMMDCLHILNTRWFGLPNGKALGMVLTLLHDVF